VGGAALLHFVILSIFFAEAIRRCLNRLYLIAYGKGSIGNTKNLVKYARCRTEKGLICITNLADQI